jgi:hypothetical protein
LIDITKNFLSDHARDLNRVLWTCSPLYYIPLASPSLLLFLKQYLTIIFNAYIFLSVIDHLYQMGLWHRAHPWHSIRSRSWPWSILHFFSASFHPLPWSWTNTDLSVTAG